MFYFSDHESYIEISPMLVTEKAFSNGFGIAIWFRIEKLNSSRPGETEPPILFSLYSAGNGGFEAYFEENKLFYRVLSGKKYEPAPDPSAVEVYEFEPCQWYQLFINHNKKYLSADVKFFVNGE